MISISRGTFSGGKTLAERVAEKLGYPCLGREEFFWRQEKRLWRLRKRTHGSRQSTSTRSGNRCLAGEWPISCVLTPPCSSTPGRIPGYHGMQAISFLAGISHVLRVRVIADMEYRIKSGHGKDET